jgi:predicted nucleic acid-binding protein
MLLIDTDVWVDHLRSFAPAVHFVEGITDTIAMSVITFAELCAGAANHHEEHAIEMLASICTLFDIDHEIARRAGALRRGYLRSHAVQLPDALIAATSQLRGARLVTLNRKHYPMLPDVLVPYRKRA